MNKQIDTPVPDTLRDAIAEGFQEYENLRSRVEAKQDSTELMFACIEISIRNYCAHKFMLFQKDVVPFIWKKVFGEGDDGYETDE